MRAGARADGSTLFRRYRAGAAGSALRPDAFLLRLRRCGLVLRGGRALLALLLRGERKARAGEQRQNETLAHDGLLWSTGAATRVPCAPPGSCRFSWHALCNKA